jgi:hypothetical protein
LTRRRGGLAVLRAVDDREPSAGAQHPQPFVDRRFGVRQRPQHVPADREVEAAGGERQVLGVGLLEADREACCRRFAAGFGEHRRGKIDARHAVSAHRQFEAEEAGAAAGVERVERPPGRRHQIEDAVPRGALGWAADAVAKILVEMRRPPVPMGGNLLFHWIARKRAHFSPTTSAKASTCSAWRDTGLRSRWLAPIATISSSRPRTSSGVP